MFYVNDSKSVNIIRIKLKSSIKLQKRIIDRFVFRGVQTGTVNYRAN